MDPTDRIPSINLQPTTRSVWSPHEQQVRLLQYALTAWQHLIISRSAERKGWSKRSAAEGRFAGSHWRQLQTLVKEMQMMSISWYDHISPLRFLCDINIRTKVNADQYLTLHMPITSQSPLSEYMHSLSYLPHIFLTYLAEHPDDPITC